MTENARTVAHLAILVAAKNCAFLPLPSRERMEVRDGVAVDVPDHPSSQPHDDLGLARINKDGVVAGLPSPLKGEGVSKSSISARAWYSMAAKVISD